jgi:hypothetical protein
VFDHRRQVAAPPTARRPDPRGESLASVDAVYAAQARSCSSWTVEGRRGKAAAKVVALPFFDPPRKRA